jgi:hypothetical protein
MLRFMNPAKSGLQKIYKEQGRTAASERWDIDMKSPGVPGLKDADNIRKCYRNSIRESNKRN